MPIAVYSLILLHTEKRLQKLRFQQSFLGIAPVETTHNP